MAGLDLWQILKQLKHTNSTLIRKLIELLTAASLAKDTLLTSQRDRGWK